MKAVPYQLVNDFKIHFCNAMNKILEHHHNCADCFDYIVAGDGDLCPVGKDIIAWEFVHLKDAAVLPKGEA